MTGYYIAGLDLDLGPLPKKQTGGTEDETEEDIYGGLMTGGYESFLGGLGIANPESEEESDGDADENNPSDSDNDEQVDETQKNKNSGDSKNNNDKPKLDSSPDDEEYRKITRPPAKAIKKMLEDPDLNESDDFGFEVDFEESTSAEFKSKKKGADKLPIPVGKEDDDGDMDEQEPTADNVSDEQKDKTTGGADSKEIMIKYFNDPDDQEDDMDDPDDEYADAAVEIPTISQVMGNISSKQASSDHNTVLSKYFDDDIDVAGEPAETEKDTTALVEYYSSYLDEHDDDSNENSDSNKHKIKGGVESRDDNLADTIADSVKDIFRAGNDTDFIEVPIDDEVPNDEVSTKKTTNTQNDNVTSGVDDSVIFGGALQSYTQNW